MLACLLLFSPPRPYPALIRKVQRASGHTHPPFPSLPLSVGGGRGGGGGGGPLPRLSYGGGGEICPTDSWHRQRESPIKIVIYSLFFHQRLLSTFAVNKVVL